MTMLHETALLLLEGFLAFISPCMLPMLPVYLMYLAADTEYGKRTSVLKTAAFVAGFSAIFMLLGAGATAIGAFLSSHRVLLRQLSGVLIALFGLHFAGLVRIPFIDGERQFFAVKKTGFVGAFLFGATFSLGWSPCLSPFLASALTLAADRKTAAEGVMYLFIFSMGLGIPYILSALFFSHIKGVFGFFRSRSAMIKRVSGAVLIAAGAAMATDYFDYWAGLFW
ncbi:MAG: cytochrome c biogenesis CcdA family protein [Synergistes sp.]|nr:cytochrome c biogenesis CcdA family protein [Synergistes sp.]